MAAILDYWRTKIFRAYRYVAYQNEELVIQKLVQMFKITLAAILFGGSHLGFWQTKIFRVWV
jgi:hypothetical protein